MTKSAWLLLLASPVAAQMPAFEPPANPLRMAQDTGARVPEPVFKIQVKYPVPVYDRSKFSSSFLKSQAEARKELIADIDDPRVVRFTIPKTKAYVQKIVDRLIAGSSLEAAAQAAPVTVRVNDSSWGSPSASMSAGVLSVDPEVVTIMDTEDEVAAVLAHELVHHFRAHHEQLALTVKKHPRTGGGDMFSPATPSKQELEARWGHECEADALSLRLLANAGYDPGAAADALKAVKREIDAEPRHQFSRGRSDGSHPPLDVRVDYMARVIAAEHLPPAARTRGDLDAVTAEAGARARPGSPETTAASLFGHYKTARKP